MFWRSRWRRRRRYNSPLFDGAGKTGTEFACLFLTDDRHKKATDNKVGIFCKENLSLISVF